MQAGEGRTWRNGGMRGDVELAGCVIIIRDMEGGGATRNSRAQSPARSLTDSGTGGLGTEKAGGPRYSYGPGPLPIKDPSTAIEVYQGSTGKDGIHVSYTSYTAMHRSY